MQRSNRCGSLTCSTWRISIHSRSTASVTFRSMTAGVCSGFLCPLFCSIFLVLGALALTFSIVPFILHLPLPCFFLLTLCSCSLQMLLFFSLFLFLLGLPCKLPSSGPTHTVWGPKSTEPLVLVIAACYKVTAKLKKVGSIWRNICFGCKLRQGQSGSGIRLKRCSLSCAWRWGRLTSLCLRQRCFLRPCSNFAMLRRASKVLGLP